MADEVPGPVSKGAAGRRPWRAVLVETAESLVTDRAGMAAAGAAFYATLALFPAISTLISLYGLVFDRAAVAAQLQVLAGIAPEPVYALIAARVTALVAQPAARLGLGLAVASAVAFWSASAGTRSVLSALNVAYGVPERRGVVRFYAVTFAMTLAAMLVAVAGIAVLVGLPVVMGFVGLARHAALLVHLTGFGMLVGFVAAAVTVLYLVGPTPEGRSSGGGGRRRVWPGVVAATVLWLVVSGVLRLYMADVVGFGVAYGPLAAVVGVMLWFYWSVYAVLVGAELNAALGVGHGPVGTRV